MPRLVYGLLRSPVLTQAPGHHPDLHTALRLLWTALPPEELRRAVYPLLSSYTTPDVQVLPTATMHARMLVGIKGEALCAGTLRVSFCDAFLLCTVHATMPTTSGGSLCRPSRGIR